jgi:hypothetical protein
MASLESNPPESLSQDISVFYDTLKAMHDNAIADAQPNATEMDAASYEAELEDLIVWMDDCAKKRVALGETQVEFTWSSVDKRVHCLGCESYPLELYNHEIVGAKFMASFKHPRAHTCHTYDRQGNWSRAVLLVKFRF